ncbi:unnamed protein product [Urochloa decumbens]|uniref:F-box domain-containing protein n=1 Tax=Urochloa decumbens TaxID=240449 RepID=A0ABC9BX18_9POAL
MSGADEAAIGCCMNKRQRTDAACASSTSTIAHLPLEILTAEILSRLPVKSLLRFRSVCKAWRSLISGDMLLVSAHLQRLPPPSSLLIFPLLLCERPDHDYHLFADYDAAETEKKKKSCSGMAFHRWDTPLATTEVSLVHAVDAMPTPEPPPQHCRRVPHDALAYCDGVVLVATAEGDVHLINPSARQAATLPPSPAGAAPPDFSRQQAFGLGRDPRSGAYKAARYFNRLTPVAGSVWSEWTAVMEVFTVGADRRWRELAAPPPPPPHRAMPGQPAAAFKGYLLWTVNDGTDASWGFLRLSLDDETLGVTPAPPCHPRLATCALSELSGELCLVRSVVEPAAEIVLEMWMAADSVRPRWERRYAIRDAVRFPWPYGYLPRPVAALDDGIVFQDEGSCHMDSYVAFYSFRTREYRETARLSMLRGYHHKRPGAGIAVASKFFVIPYGESLLQLNGCVAETSDVAEVKPSTARKLFLACCKRRRTEDVGRK